MWSHAFTNTGVTSLAFPASLEFIDWYAFSECSALETITFAEGSVLEAIKYSAFYKTGVTSMDFPASLEFIDSRAFYDCSSLTNVTFDGSACYPTDITVCADGGGDASTSSPCQQSYPSGSTPYPSFGGSTPADPQQCARQ
jgi:hypothetical protein